MKELSRRLLRIDLKAVYPILAGYEGLSLLSGALGKGRV